MSTIPCHRGGHNCNWPACPQDCDGRPSADAYSAALDKLDDRQCADAEAERDTALAEVARLREVLIPIVDEFSCTIEQYNKIGPDFTHKDGTEVFMVQTVLDREPLIVAARAALASKETP